MQATSTLYSSSFNDCFRFLARRVKTYGLAGILVQFCYTLAYTLYLFQYQGPIIDVPGDRIDQAVHSFLD